jgi:hypothetical protein
MCCPKGCRDFCLFFSITALLIVVIYSGIVINSNYNNAITEYEQELSLNITLIKQMESSKCQDAEEMKAQKITKKCGEWQEEIARNEGVNFHQKAINAVRKHYYGVDRMDIIVGFVIIGVILLALLILVSVNISKSKRQIRRSAYQLPEGGRRYRSGDCHKDD